MYLTYLDHLPKLPDHLVKECLDSIYAKSAESLRASYQHHQIPKAVYDFVATFFDPKDYDIRLHSICQGTGIHTDWRRIANNYLLQTGGEAVHTYWFGNERGWNPNNPPVSEKYIIEPFRWHRLEVDVNHGVLEVETLRIAISVTRHDDTLETICR